MERVSFPHLFTIYSSGKMNFTWCLIITGNGIKLIKLTDGVVFRQIISHLREELYSYFIFLLFGANVCICLAPVEAAWSSWSIILPWAGALFCHF